ncbi:MAG: UpxY family transcription antiterminator [Bacteroidetes bacterium]|nr:UpxY family transcription antiterminator [Bacteroidota bacterium]MBS1609165.1 UpxY family transcription antiterminator [Bacteroidota bacterium]
MSEAKWLAVYTRPRCEKKVADLLTKRKIHNYCPMNTSQRQWSDRKKVIFEPLFTSYVFVNLTEKERVTVLETAGVINFVYWLGKPAIIRDEEIGAIKFFLKEYQSVTLEKKMVNLNDEVRIINGPLMLRKGNVLEVRNSTVKVTLPSLGHTLVAEIRKDNIENLTYAEASGFRI